MTSPSIWRTLHTMQAGMLAMLLLTGPGSLPGAERKEAKFLLAWGKKGDKPGEFYSPISIAIDRRDVVYVTDLNNARLQRFTTEGQYLGGFDLPLDNPPRKSCIVGGPTMVKLVGATMPHGIVFLYGALSPEPTTVPALELLAKFIVLRGFWVPEITLDPTRLERGKRFVNEGLADGSLKPIIAKTFPLEEIVEAHRYLESNQQIGKVVVRV